MEKNRKAMENNFQKDLPRVCMILLSPDVYTERVETTLMVEDRECIVWNILETIRYKKMIYI